MKKSFNVVVIGFGLFVLGVTGFAMLISGGGTQGAAISAESMMQNATAGNWLITRQHLTLPYANAMPEDKLKQLASDLKMDQYRAMQWAETSVNGTTAELNGNMTTNSGETVSLVFSMEQAQGQWKIADVKRKHNDLSTTPKTRQLAKQEPAPATSPKPTATPQPATPPQPIAITVSGPATKSANKTRQFENTSRQPLDIVNARAQSALPVKGVVPTRRQASKLVSKWTQEFQKAVESEDFKFFHMKTAEEFQNQFSLTKFTQIFQPFIDRKIDLVWVKKAQPKFKRPPMIDANGVVFVIGEFNGPSTLNFEYRFANENDNWKPVEVYLALGNDSDETLPALKQIKQMVTDKTLEFGKAVHDQDFSTFHRVQLATPFRKKFPVAKFAEIFKEFVNERANLEWIADVEPEFEVPPSLNTEGVLQAQGSFPSSPKVNFRFAFIREDAQWKMVFININVPPEDEDTDQANASQSIPNRR